MIVEFLSSNSKFAAVKYNNDKLSCGKAELMAVRNFQALNSVSKPRAADFKAYLQLIGSLNPKVKNKQLHLSIMAKGKSRSKAELTDIAHQWLKRMGYGNNPYLIYFHNDNPNNHVHIVSVRVCKNRKAVPTRYEEFRSSVVLHELIGHDPVAQAERDATKALAYGFNSLDQFQILLKNMGYCGYMRDSALHMVKHSRTLHAVNLDVINHRIQQYHPSPIPVHALNSVFKTLLKIVSGKPIRHPSFWHAYLRQAYKSELSILLSEQLKIDIIYHRKNREIVGFTVINHEMKLVHDGKEIIDLSILSKNLENPEGYIDGDKVIFFKTDEVRNKISEPIEKESIYSEKNQNDGEKARLKR